MISVVIPVYNKVRYIERALNSVLAQTCQDFEVIVVNDGSTDGSEKVVEHYLDQRIRLVHQENAGVSAARNRGIAEARAVLIAFIDADDEWLPEFLGTILRLYRMFPDCGAYATAYEVVTPDGSKRTPSYKGIPAPPWEGIIPNYFRAALGGEPVWSSAVAVPRRVFDSIGAFPVGVPYGEDIDMWCRIALKHLVAFSTKAGAVYHKEATNRVCMQVAKPPFDEGRLLRIVECGKKAGNLPPGVSPDDLDEWLSDWFITRAIIYVLRGQRTRARELLRRAASTRAHRGQRIKWSLLSYVPYPLLMVMARARKIASTTGAGLA